LLVVASILLPLRIDEFPADLQREFCGIMNQITKYEPVANEGRIEATLYRIRNSTGEKIAIRIFNIHAKLQEIRGHSYLYLQSWS